MPHSQSPKRKSESKPSRYMYADRLLLRVSDWGTFRNAMRDLPNKQKEVVFERFTQLYLQSSPAYNRKLKHIWLLNEVPPKVAQNLNLPTDDIGIDLVAETMSGEFWAIQCKYRQDEKSSPTYGELSTFLALVDSISKKFSFKLIATSTERITHRLKGLADLGIIATDDWCSLTPEHFRQIKQRLRTSKSRQPKLLPYKPKKHQVRAIKNAQTHFIENGASRGKLISPCGSGKSLTSYWIAQKLQSKLILVAVPSLALIKQVLTEWMRELMATNQNADWICVCSDQTASQIEIDSSIAYTQELGVPSTTDQKEIVSWLKRRNGTLKIVFTTYQSGEVVAKAAKEAKVHFDLGILDEAHKTVGPKVKQFAHLLFDKTIRIRKRLFMTATERCYRGSSDQIVSMDDVTVYGDTFELLTFRDALLASPPILCDYKIVTATITDSQVQDLLKNDKFVNPSSGSWPQITAEELAGIVALRKTINRRQIKHAISFHGSIRRAKAFMENQNRLTTSRSGYGRLECFHVFGQMPTAIRYRLLRQFAASNRALVTNARCLTEGVNIPEVDCVFFADPKQSTTDIVQAAGRAMRLSKGKQIGYIVVPVFHQNNIKVEELLQSKHFKTVLTVLSSLASNDGRIIEYFSDGVNRKRSKQRGIVEFDVHGFIPTMINLAEFTNAIKLKIWQRLARLAWRPFDEARAFVHRLGLSAQKDWVDYCKSGKKPQDIPTSPSVVYYGEGWISWGDWLGTGAVASQWKTYRPFVQARAFVRRLKLTSTEQWRVYVKSGKMPDDIPAAPWRTYRNKGWKGMGDWLGTKFVATRQRKYRPFPEAREHARQLGLKSRREWIEYTKSGKMPEDISSVPDRTYAGEGWVSWGDWLGTGRIKNCEREYREFEESRKHAHSLGLKSKKAWDKYSQSGQKPEDVPSCPDQTYLSEGWVSWGDWLGTGTVATRQRAYLPFIRARAFVHELGIKQKRPGWDEYCQSGNKPHDIPANPNKIYKDRGWKGWGDWLGTKNVAARTFEYRAFRIARAFVRRLGLKSLMQWKEYCASGKKPKDIPSHPENTYRNKGYKGIKDWLGSQ